MYTSLQHILSNFNWIIPEIILLVLVVVLFVIDMLKAERLKKVIPIVTVVGILIALVFVCLQYRSIVAGSEHLIYNSFLKVDLVSCYIKGIVGLSAIATVVYTLISFDYNRQGKGEFYYVLIGIVVGLYFLAMSSNFLMLFLSLETVSIGSYILTVFNFNKNGIEAGIKYVLFGAFCTGIMLFGMSLWYGSTGSIGFPAAIPVQVIQTIDVTTLVLVVFMLLTGLLFKVSAFPFHVWTPDVYQGAPMPIVAFLSVAPKMVGLVLLYKLVKPLLQIGELTEILTLLLASIAILTMVIGNFSALLQKNTRRMLAYSTIGHAGFVMMVILTPTSLTTTALLFYLTTYLFMNFTAFVLVDLFVGETGVFDVNNFKGLGLKMPYMGGIFVISMIALTGLPPTVGFYAKLFVFSALWEGYQLTGNTLFVYLLGIGLLNTVISLFYYLRIPYFLFFKKEESGSILTSVPIMAYVFITLISLPLLVLFFNPNWVLNLFENIKL